MRPCGRGHEDAHALLAAHRVFGRAAGVAGGRAQDVQLFAAARQFVLEQVAQQLHRHVLEGQRRAVGQGFEVDAVLQLASAARSPPCRTPRRCRSCGRSRAGRRPGCRRCRATGFRTRVRRTAGRAISRASPRRPADSARAGTGRRRAPGPPAGSRRNACGPGRRGWTGSASGELFLADAHDRRQHGGQAPASGRARRSSCLRARLCVRMIRSVCVEPSPPTSPASRCSIASMLMPAAASRPVTLASTPAWSATRRRR